MLQERFSPVVSWELRAGTPQFVNLSLQLLQPMHLPGTTSECMLLTCERRWCSADASRAPAPCRQWLAAADTL